MSTVMKISPQGQVRIPKKIMGKLGLAKGDYVEVEIIQNEIVLKPRSSLTFPRAGTGLDRGVAGYGICRGRWNGEWAALACFWNRRGRGQMAERIKSYQFSRPFKKEYLSLPKEIQKTFDEELKLFLHDMSHPSLRVKGIQGTKDRREGSVTKKYRSTFQFSDKTILFRAIDTHDILNRKFP
jgi:AbrB family looped-hinge helix DNA binding protein